MTSEFLNGNQAAAQAARLARIDVVAAYPITPQTTVVEYLAQMIASGELNAIMLRVESEHSALSAMVGSSLVGARSFTASSSQGLALMSEVLYFASGMRVPVVMAVANRTLSQPVNIWADHQDSLVNRDSGWLQFYSESPQEVFDNILQAYRICEDGNVLLPAMVCYDGFIISHVAERMSLLPQDLVDQFLPKSIPEERLLMDPSNPQQFGEVVYPDWYPDIEYKKHKALYDSRETVLKVAKEFEELSGRRYGLIEEYHASDAEIIFVGMGSLTSTTKWVVNRLREKGRSVGLVKVRCFRPFPDEELLKACESAKVLAVLDRDIGYGTTGMLYPDVTRAFYHSDGRPTCLNFIIGLGGKDIGPETIMNCFEISEKALEGRVDQYIYWPDARKYEEEG